MNADNCTRVTGLFHFRGFAFEVVSDGEDEYIYAKRLSDLVGLDWRSQKRMLKDEENTALLGIKELAHPVSTPEGETSTPTFGLYMRLKRVEIYYARLSTRMIRGKGNDKAADFILALQHEWADALHSYESQGLAIRNSYFAEQIDRQKSVNMLMTMRNKAQSEQEKKALTNLINKGLAQLGETVEEATI